MTLFEEICKENIDNCSECVFSAVYGCTCPWNCEEDCDEIKVGKEKDNGSARNFD